MGDDASHDRTAPYHRPEGGTPVMNYPITFWVESIDGCILLSCAECGVHHSFGEAVSLDDVMIESQVHQDMHLVESLRGRAPEMAPPVYP